MPPLKTRSSQFILTGHPFTRPTGDSRCAVRRSAADFIDPHLSLKCIGQTDDHEALMQQRDMKRQNRGFLSAMLGGAAGEHAANLSDQGASGTVTVMFTVKGL